jgi:uncharacterized protein YdhG (YjbR/CyaY superfamily)
MSFSDMMSSSRGPGVIGMLMALMVLLGFGALFMFAFDEGLQGGEQSIESVIANQVKEIANDQRSITAGRELLAQVPTKVANAKELNRLKYQNDSLKTKTADLVGAVAAKKAEVASSIDTFEAYKDRFRAYIRGKAKGESMGTLETLTGITYTNVNIREVTAIGIQIRHEGGQKRIPFEELPEETKERFQFDPKQKEKALTQESENLNKHEAAVAVADQIADQQLDQQREVDAAKAQEKRKLTILMKESQIQGLEDEIRGLNSDLDRAAAAAAAARAAGRMHLNKSNTISGTIRLKQNRIAALRSEVQQLRAAL